MSKTERTTDTSMQPMTFDEWAASRQLQPRTARIMRSFDLCGMKPTEMTWTLLHNAAVSVESVDDIRLRGLRERRLGLTSSRVDGGCTLIRVQAWEQRGRTRPKKSR